MPSTTSQREIFVHVTLARRSLASSPVVVNVQDSGVLLNGVTAVVVETPRPVDGTTSDDRVAIRC